MRGICLDLGGTHIGCAVIEDDKLLASSELSLPNTQKLAPLLPAIEAELLRLIKSIGLEMSDIQGMAIAFPGIVDFRTSTILSTLGKYDDAPTIDLRGWSRRSFGLEMRIENDARMALLGEHYVGAAVGIDDVVMLTLGTGIGGTAMMQGRLLRGVHAHAGSVGGHFVVDVQGRSCKCGGIGCAEAEASGSTLYEIARGWRGYSESSLNNGEVVHFKTLFSEANGGDRVAIEIRDRCLRVWAANIVTQVLAYDPEIVVIGGGVIKSAEAIIPFIQSYIDAHTWAVWGKPRIVPAKLGNDAGLLGCTPLLIEGQRISHP